MRRGKEDPEHPLTHTGRRQMCVALGRGNTTIEEKRKEEKITRQRAKLSVLLGDKRRGSWRVAGLLLLGRNEHDKRREDGTRRTVWVLRLRATGRYIMLTSALQGSLFRGHGVT